ncbi:MAG: hypothetical protein ACPGN3_03200 [Opitutales bacterium]
MKNKLSGLLPSCLKRFTQSGAILTAASLYITPVSAQDSEPFQGIGNFGPFAIHSGGTLEDTMFEEFGMVIDHRDIITAYQIFGDIPISPDRARNGIRALFTKYDEIILFSARNGVDRQSIATLQSKFTSDEYDMDYILPTGEELEMWKRFVSAMVERYDGDDDYGCLVNIAGNTTDCYFPGDGLYPDEELQDAITNYPVKHWQIEQEWLHTIYVYGDPTARPPYALADGPTLDAHFDEMKAVIKAADPEAFIVIGAMNPSKPHMLEEGYVRAGFVENGDDCTYRVLTPEGLETAPQADKDYRAAYEEKFEYLMWNTVPKADIVDFHFRVREDPYLLQEAVQFLRDKMPPETDVEIWGLEISGPYYYFPLLGLQAPGDTDPSYCEDGTNLAPYHMGIQADYLLKLHAIGFASGLKSFFYAAGNPEVNFEANYQRNALIDNRALPNPLTYVDGWSEVVFNQDGRKPAYFTYAMMIDLIRGFEAATEIGKGVYRFDFPVKDPIYLIWDEIDGVAREWVQGLPSSKTIGVVAPIRDAGVTSTAPVELLPADVEERITEVPLFILGADVE